MVLRPLHLTLATAVVAGLLTLLAGVLSPVELAYRSESAHVAIETAAALAALLVSYLMCGRFQQSRSVADLLVVAAFALLGVSALFFAVLPTTLPTIRALDSFASWAPALASLLGTAVLVSAAFVPTSRRMGSPTIPLGFALGATLAVAAMAALTAGLLAGLATGSDSTPSPAWPGRDHVVIFAVQIVSAPLFAAAALGFTRRAERTRDELMRWLAVATTLGAFARFNYVVFPSLYSDYWVYTGDLLWLSLHVVLVVGAAREIAAYHRRLAEASMVEDRRRVARNLHDGLAQELNFIVAKLRRRAMAGDADLMQALSAAERALDESRRAIIALASKADERFDAALARAAEEVAGRVGIRVQLEVERGIDPEPDAYEALLRIVREAVTNAGRHGQAKNVAVRLSNSQGVRLAISDDGRGFDPATTTNGGFGLVSMRERVQALGGHFHLESHPGDGTRIDVALP